MSTVGNACCAQCRFWQPPVSSPESVNQVPAALRKNPELLYWQKACKRRAPKIAKEQKYGHMAGTAEWPETTGGQWCGEFEQYTESVGAL